MIDVRLAEAQAVDVELLVEMMEEFYFEAGYPLDRARVRTAFQELRRTPQLGRAFIIERGAETAGYLVLTVTYSMEYSGRAAFLDDLFVRPEHRGRGVGTAALRLLLENARQLGIRAVHLEVGRDNAAAHALYRKVGFTDNDRQLLTVRLAAASHEAGERSHPGFGESPGTPSGIG